MVSCFLLCFIILKVRIYLQWRFFFWWRLGFGSTLQSSLFVHSIFAFSRLLSGTTNGDKFLHSVQFRHSVASDSSLPHGLQFWFGFFYINFSIWGVEARQVFLGHYRSSKSMHEVNLGFLISCLFCSCLKT